MLVMPAVLRNGFGKKKNEGKIIYDHEPPRTLMHNAQLKPLVFTQERIKPDISEPL